jgi:hypothetical protein
MKIALTIVGIAFFIALIFLITLDVLGKLQRKNKRNYIPTEDRHIYPNK